MMFSACLVFAASMSAVACDDMASPDSSEEAQLSRVMNATFTQEDRFGIPAINTVFIPSAKKDLFNTSVPASDQANFRGDVLATLAAFGVAPATANGIADAVLPDAQPINVNMPTAFLNGRKPSDDVITGELMLIFGANADLNDDHVDANDKPFLTTFPFLAAPHVQ
jgi:hypothetical protein